MQKCCITFTVLLLTMLTFQSVYAIDRVSLSSSGVQGDGYSSETSISANGQFIAYYSRATNLVEGDTNNIQDIFLHDRNSGITERVNISTNGTQANDLSLSVSISNDGQYIAFQSSASNLVNNDTNNVSDVFVHNRQSGITERVSVSSNGEQANNYSRHPVISSDGRFIAFNSWATNLVGNFIRGLRDIYLHDRETGITKRVSVTSNGNQGFDDSFHPSISADGQFIAFETYSRLVANDSNFSKDIYVHDHISGITERASVASNGQQGNSDSVSPFISADGRFVTFTSAASTLVEGEDTNQSDIYVHDRHTAITERVNVSSKMVQGNGSSGISKISANGRYVVYNSWANNLVDSDTNATLDIFLHDRESGKTELVSVSDSGIPGNARSDSPSISADGSFIAFSSGSTNLLSNDTNGKSDIFVSSNKLLSYDTKLTAAVQPTSGVVMVNEYIRFRARLTNTSTQALKNCKVELENPLINWQRQFSFYSRPLNVTNPQINSAIDIAPGETAQFILAVLPRVTLRKEVRFNYTCDSISAFNIPFVNTVFLTAKTQPFISEDYLQLKNSNNRTSVAIDRSSGKYWTPYIVNLINTGSTPSSVNLSTTKDISGNILGQPQLCEPVDPQNGNWSCLSPRAAQAQIELGAAQTKKILIFLHAKQAIEKRNVKNRIIVEARDSAGDVVAKNSIGVYTLD